VLRGGAVGQLVPFSSFNVALRTAHHRWYCRPAAALSTRRLAALSAGNRFASVHDVIADRLPVVSDLVADGHVRVSETRLCLSVAVYDDVSRALCRTNVTRRYFRILSALRPRSGIRGSKLLNKQIWPTLYVRDALISVLSPFSIHTIDSSQLQDESDIGLLYEGIDI